MPRILLIDDDPDFSQALRGQLQELGHEVQWLDLAEEGLRHLSETGADLVLLDNKMPRMSGLEFLAALKERGLRLPVILMTSAHNDHTVIDAIALGAFTYVIKPLDFAEMLGELGPFIRRALEVHYPLKPEAIPEPCAKSGDDSLIVGRSQPMLDVLMCIGQLARVDEAVLILGETGTGKELVARAVHRHSHRAAAPFLAINCAAIPEQLLESELFGHEKGAFTGADRRRLGKFEQCSGGTLFLDEIGDMTPLTQSKILRLLQDQRFERVGGNETLQTDVRLIAATNAHLETAVAQGRFRQDLYYRLNVFTIHLPPLRARGDDLPLLVQHFVRRFSPELGRQVRSVSPKAMDALRRYSWPGNIRELQSVLKQALLQATGPVLMPGFLPLLAGGEVNAAEAKPPDEGAAWAGLRKAVVWAWNSGQLDLWPLLQQRLEYEMLRYALTQPAISQVDLARRLGVARNTLRARLKLHELQDPADGS